MAHGNQTITVRGDDDTADERAARMCAELTRQGIAFKCEQCGGYWLITLTGF